MKDVRQKPKTIKTPVGDISLTVNEQMASHQNDPFIQKKVAEAAQLLKEIGSPIPQ